MKGDDMGKDIYDAMRAERRRIEKLVIHMWETDLAENTEQGYFEACEMAKQIIKLNGRHGLTWRIPDILERHESKATIVQVKTQLRVGYFVTIDSDYTRYIVRDIDDDLGVKLNGLDRRFDISELTVVEIVEDESGG